MLVNFNAWERKEIANEPASEIIAYILLYSVRETNEVTYNNRCSLSLVTIFFTCTEIRKLALA